jgi:hypothetical protein
MSSWPPAVMRRCAAPSSPWSNRSSLSRTLLRSHARVFRADGQIPTSRLTHGAGGRFSPVAGEVIERAFDADDNLSDATKRFIDRHVTPSSETSRASAVLKPTTRNAL